MVTLVTVVLSGCGSSAPTPVVSQPVRSPAVGDAGPLGGYGGEAPGNEAPSEAVTGPTFPLTLRRTGGSASFEDTVVLQSDGRVVVDNGAIHGRLCVLETDQRRELLAALSTLRLGGASTSAPSATVPGVSDPIRITVTDVHGRPVELSDPSLGAVSGMVAALVADVTLTSPAQTRCTSATG
mgnify:CR=1 FL=1